MSGQLIITLSREFGSGGHEIANLLAKRFGLPVYEENMLSHIAQKRGIRPGVLERYDELPKNKLMYRTVKGFSNAPEDVTAQMQFEYLRERADAGESFLVVGRCAEEVLKDYPGRVSFFVHADKWFKLKRTMDREPITKMEALALMDRKNWKRKTYHNQYCKGKWGDAWSYDLCVNSAKLGVQGTADLLERYIRARVETISHQEP